MAEMSNLLGYEIVDKKAREMIANLGGGGTGGAVEVPTKVSELENDAGYITADDLPINVSELSNNIGYAIFSGSDSVYEAANATQCYGGITKEEFPYILVNVIVDRNIMTVNFAKSILEPDESSHIKFGWVANFTKRDVIIPENANLSDITAIVVDAINNYDSVDNGLTYACGMAFVDDDNNSYYANFDLGTISTKPPAKWGMLTSFGTAGQYIVTNGDGTIGFADVTVPTKVSELQNDAGYITADDIPDVGIVPTKVSELENDAGYIIVDDLSDIESRLTALENIDIAEGGAY